MKRYFISDPDQPRMRRASDAVVVATGLILLIWTALRSETVHNVEQAIYDLAQSVPTWFDQLYQIGYFLGFAMVVVLVIATISQGMQRLDLLRDMMLALVGSIVIAWVLVILDEGANPVLLPEFSSSAPEPAFPIMRVAMVTGVMIVASPQLIRPIRRTGWAILILVAISGFGLGLGFPGDAAGGVSIGMISGGLVLLVFGSPRGYPDMAQITAALADLGLNAHGIELTSDQSWGVRRLNGKLDNGRRIEIKAYGRDAADSQFLGKVWRNLWYRDEAQQFNLNRLQGVEHEALAIVMAERSGVVVPEVLGVGIGGEDLALLATDDIGARREDHDLTEANLVAAWHQVAAIHASGMSHGQLSMEAFRFDDSSVVVHDFAAASFSASDDRMSVDIVSLLTASTEAIDADTAVRAARTGIGDEALVAALPFLQVPALNRKQRKRIAQPKALVKQLRGAVANATGVDLPEPAKLRRIRWQDLVMPALSLVAVYALIGMLSDIDFAAVWEVVRDATWPLIVVGFLIGQFVFLPEATGMLFATGYPLPLRPLTILQVSVKWIGLAVPSAAGRVTMNTLFLRKYGVSPTVALTQGAIDGISGFVVEAGILVVAFIASDMSFDIDTSELNWVLILTIVGVIIIGTVVTVLRVRRLRDAVVPVISEAWKLLAGVLKDPKRALGLLGSNLASRLILGVTLWFILQGIGAPLPLVTCVVVTVATNLLAGLVPIPGGIGVAEAVLTSFLVLAGLPSEVAFAAAVVFRMATFYIPAGEGFFAMKWLQGNGYL